MGRELKFITLIVDKETDMILVKQEDKLDSDQLLNIKNRLADGELISAHDVCDNATCISSECIDPKYLSDNQELQEIMNAFLN